MRHLIKINEPTLKEQILKIYPDISDSEMVDIGKVIIEMSRHGIKIEQILIDLEKIEISKIFNDTVIKSKTVMGKLSESF